VAYFDSGDFSLWCKIFDMVREMRWRQIVCILFQGFMHWPARYGHTQAEIWELIAKESDFDCRAYNSRTHARGLMQVRIIAIKDIPNSARFFRWKHISENRRIRFLHKKRVYDPYWNLKIGCAYYRICKKRAKAQKIGRFEFSKREIAKAYYISGYGNWHLGVSATLSYLQK